MSSFMTEQILNGEQLTNETINLEFKIIKYQYSFWNNFEDITPGPIQQYHHHKKNFKYFTVIITGQLYLVKL